MIETLKTALFILLYIACGLTVCYICKAVEVLDTNDSNKWKWDDVNDPITVILFPFVVIFFIIPLFIKNIIAIPIITITEIIKAKRNMRDKNADSN